jgi:hypothetical protein
MYPKKQEILGTKSPAKVGKYIVKYLSVAYTELRV